jgi:formylglycine-generating enzyme required for sulfatase activity
VGAKQNGSEQHGNLSDIAKVNCQFCGAEAKPYSRFCESCGKRIDGNGGAENVAPSPVAIPISTPEPPPVKPELPEKSLFSAPTLFELPSQAEGNVPAVASVQAYTQTGESGSPGVAGNAAVNPANEISSTSNGATVAEELAPPATAESLVGKSQESFPQVRIEDRPQTHTGTVVTPLPPFGRVPDEVNGDQTFQNAWSRNQSAILQSAVVLGLIALLGLVLIWWFWVDRPINGELKVTAPATPMVIQVEPSQPPSPTPQTTPEVPAAPDTMTFIPGGVFEMGRADGDEYEKPAHQVTVAPFFMDRTEVTNEEYQRFVAATDHRTPPHWPDGSFPESDAKLPVVNVSWDDANTYAKWANKRLPTEAEWEFAARGTDGRIYPWGNTWNSSASNAGHNVGGRISKVGSFPNGASPFGVLDMCGNVWEWTASSLKNYAQNDQEIAPGKVIRGGAFDVPSARATATYRGVLPEDRLPDKTGFRTVRDAVKP